MQQEVMIGVDIGTTSTKAVAFDLDSNLLFEHAITYPMFSRQPGYVEQNPDDILEAVLQTIIHVRNKAEEAAYQVAGVSFSSAMHSLIVLDDAGKLLTNCIIWADVRSKAQAERLKNSVIGHSIYLNTGTPIHPMSPLPKLMWLRENEPELMQKAGKIIGIKEYVWYKLFGEFVVDHSVASATGLLNIFDLSWHSDSLTVAGISEEQLSKPVTGSYSNFNLKPSYSQQLQLPDKTPFIVGANDGCLANLGANALSPGNMVITIGTSGAVRIMSDKPATDPQERVFSYVLSSGQYVLGGAVNNGGIILQWFLDTFYTSEKETLRSSQAMYELLSQEAASVPPGADGLLFIPYLLGERAPVWDADAKGAFIGLHLNHTRAHLARAVLEGITYNIFGVVDALEQATGQLKNVFANGGFARSGFWVQLLADVLNKEIHLTETCESSAMGAAIMGWYSLGKIHNLEEGARRISITRTYKPNPENHAIYQKHYKVFAQLYPALKNTFGELSQLRSEPR